MRLVNVEGPRVDAFRNHTFGQVEYSREVLPAVRDRQTPSSEAGLHHRAGNVAVPRVGQPACRVRGVRQVRRSERPGRADVLHDGVHVDVVAPHDVVKPPRPGTVYFPAVAQQRPGLHRDDRRFVGPLLREAPASVDDVVQLPLRVGAQTGEGHDVVARADDVHEIQLQQAEAADEVGQARRRDPGRPGAAEPLRGEGNPSRRGDGQVAWGHRCRRRQPDRFCDRTMPWLTLASWREAATPLPLCL